MRPETRKVISAMLQKRWGLTQEQGDKIFSIEGSIEAAIVVSFLLNAIFDDNEESEKIWIETPRARWQGKSAKDIMLDNPEAVYLVRSFALEELGP